MDSTPKDDRHPTQAYRNETFLNSSDARALRILSEYLEPASRFDHHGIDDTIVFYGSARLASREAAEAALEEARASGGDVAAAERKLELSRYYEATRELARRITEWSKGLTDSTLPVPGRSKCDRLKCPSSRKTWQ